MVYDLIQLQQSGNDYSPGVIQALQKGVEKLFQ